jgi:hypothetical protein
LDVGRLQTTCSSDRLLSDHGRRQLQHLELIGRVRWQINESKTVVVAALIDMITPVRGIIVQNEKHAAARGGSLPAETKIRANLQMSPDQFIAYAPFL